MYDIKPNLCVTRINSIYIFSVCWKSRPTWFNAWMSSLLNDITHAFGFAVGFRTSLPSLVHIFKCFDLELLYVGLFRPSTVKRIIGYTCPIHQVSLHQQCLLVHFLALLFVCLMQSFDWTVYDVVIFPQTVTLVLKSSRHTK